MSPEPVPAVRLAPSRAATPALTAREIEVLRSLASGLSNAEIGRRLFISDATVKCHVAQIIAKLRVRDRLQAVLVALRVGLVEVGDPDTREPWRADRPAAHRPGEYWDVHRACWTGCSQTSGPAEAPR